MTGTLLLPGALVLPPLLVVAAPLLFVGAAKESAAAEIRRNFAMKELQSTMVAPGDVKSGFVYFKLPKTASSAEWRLEIPLLDPQTKAVLKFDYWLKEKVASLLSNAIRQ